MSTLFDVAVSVSGDAAATRDAAGRPGLHIGAGGLADACARPAPEFGLAQDNGGDHDCRRGVVNHDSDGGFGHLKRAFAVEECHAVHRSGRHGVGEKPAARSGRDPE